MEKKSQLGLVGLGLLGGALGRRLVSQGWPVKGFDLDHQARAHFATIGGRACNSLEEALEGCSIIILCLPNSDISHDVLDSILSEKFSDVRADSLTILDTTTGAPDRMIANGELARSHGVDYFDACVGGSSSEAERGEAIMMVGGQREFGPDCVPVLSSLSEQVFFLPNPGDGAKMKLVTNLVLGLTRIALAEGFALSEGLGVDLSRTLEILQAGPARSHAMKVKGSKMIARDFHPQAKLSQHLKDVRLITQMASQLKISLPMSDLHEKILDLCEDEGWGDLDNSCVVQAYFLSKTAKLR